MPSWNELIAECDALPNDGAKTQWLLTKQQEALSRIGEKRGANAVFYASAFLQKPGAPPPSIQITPEDLNGFMGVIHGMDWSKPLTVLLHTPGGVTTAAETIVEYLRSKFSRIEVVVPTFAMSAGTMIALGSDNIVMGRQSQLGPIDPQMGLGGRMVSAQAIVAQFNKAKGDIKKDVTMAHAWAPVLQSLGPDLIAQAQYALQYGEEMVARWLARYMLEGQADADANGKKIAAHFNDAGKHKNHGRRIGRDEARTNGITVEDLEDDQEFQEHVLTAYHLATITFEKTIATKALLTGTGQSWIKQWAPGPAR